MNTLSLRCGIRHTALLSISAYKHFSRSCQRLVLCNEILQLENWPRSEGGTLTLLADYFLVKGVELGS
jgi:hypothetical protein